MIRVFAFGEGSTEATFLSEVIAPSLTERDINLEAGLISTSSNARGGALTPQRVLRAVRNMLRQDRGIYVTTFFDLYGLRRDFFGVRSADSSQDPLQRCKIVEDTLADAVVKESGCRRERFFPHIQPYEFEALLFSKVSSFENVNPQWRRYIDELKRARDRVDSPEHINDGPRTHPSARLEALAPKYDKHLDGSRIAATIGIARIRSECRHFDAWMTRIEALKPLR